MIRFPKLICAVLLLAFGVLSYTAAITKNSTYDETLHVPAAWTTLHGDYRVNPEHPPLWKYWCALPHLIWPIDIRAGANDEKLITENFAYEWNWAVDVLYRTPDNNGNAIVNRARFMMMLVALGLGAVLVGWTWKLGGPLAAVVAGTLYCFDPNFLAHGSLVTNDVAMTLCFFAWLWALWRLGRNASGSRIIVSAVLLGVAILVKFSGLFLAPMLALMLVIRAFSGSWRVCGKELVNVRSRLAAALGICLFTGIVTYAMIWAAYGFRYAAIPGGKQPLAWELLLEKTQYNDLFSQHPGTQVQPAEAIHWTPSLGTRGILFAKRHHLLPEAFCFGILFVRASGLVRSAYLMGQISLVGWWYYFPLAILFKTPTATLAAIFIAAIIAWRKIPRWRHNPEQRWLALVLVVPALIYFLIVMTANLDLGLRHILEIYPPIYLGIGLAAARIGRTGKIIAVLLAAVLIVESVTAWPNFIPFFNWPSGGWRGGINLLGDSNLDWGQDIKLLGQWQKTHRDRKLYLLYFGTADPAYYGVVYNNLPGSYMLGPLMALPTTPGIIAASATCMQGIYLDGAEHESYGWMMHAKPITVLGGSIYLFEYPYHGPLRN